MNDSLKDISDLKSKCIEALTVFDDNNIIRIFDSLDNSINKVTQSWSNSWIGYQAYVYYAGFTSPQPGDNFSIEWGFQSMFNSPVSDNWQQYNYEQVLNVILGIADISQDEVNSIEKSLALSKKIFQESKNDFITIIEILYNQNKEQYLEKILDEATNIKIFSQSDFINGMRPTQAVTRDSEALMQGIKTPPHISFQTYLLSLKSIKLGLENLITCQKKAEIYIKKTFKDNSMDSDQKYIFIGHGRSVVWKELKDFLKDRLNLNWDEFNRESTAGVATSERLQEMVDSSKFAFIVMTAEDEHSDGNKHARENIVHEAGLFQGKLGFRKAIILLEEGCAEFSNIFGLGQIRFPKGNLEPKFEEIRRVLEREKIIS